MSGLYAITRDRVRCLPHRNKQVPPFRGTWTSTIQIISSADQIQEQIARRTSGIARSAPIFPIR